jgi:hypothetical protein
VFFRKFWPAKVRYSLAEKYPEKAPARIKRAMPTLTKPPRKLGLRMPKQLSSSRPAAIMRSCIPDPTIGAKRPA